VPKVIEVGNRSIAVKLRPPGPTGWSSRSTLAGGAGPTWRKLVEFDLSVASKALHGEYVVHRNLANGGGHP
jgi:hypothetical protein